LNEEELECLRDWENYMMLDRLPHELGYAAEPYPEDIEALKTMKRWMQEREERERKKEEMKRRTLEKVRRASRSSSTTS
jgi:hypothetical protein